MTSPWIVLVAALLPLAEPTRPGTQGEGPDEGLVRCVKCRNAGRLPCPVHKRQDCELEDNVLHCSVVGDCETCAGTGWTDCPRCANAPVEGRLAAKAADQAAQRQAVARLHEEMGRRLRLATSEHFVLVVEVDRMKVGRSNLGGHELLHLYVDRLERLFADYVGVLGVDEKEFRQRSKVLIWSSLLDHEQASARFCNQTAVRGVKLMGVDPTYSVPALKRFFKDDETLHRNVLHNTVHLLLSHQEPSNWIGQLKGGWADAGLAHWFEERAFQVCDNYCYQEVYTSRRLAVDSWRARARERVAEDEAPGLGELFGQNTDTLAESQHLISFSLVDFLLAQDPAKTNEVFRLLRSKTPSRDALQAVFGWNLFELEGRWRAWVLETYPKR